MKNYELRKQARIAREQLRWEIRKIKWRKKILERDLKEMETEGIIATEEAEVPEIPKAIPVPEMQPPASEIKIIPAKPRKLAKRREKKPEPVKEEAARKLVKRKKKLKPVKEKLVKKPVKKGKIPRKPKVVKRRKKVTKPVKRGISKRPIEKGGERLRSVRRLTHKHIKRIVKGLKPVKKRAAGKSVKETIKGVRIRENIARLGSVKKRIPGGPIKERIRGVAKKERIRKLKSVKGLTHKHIKRLAKRLKRR